MNDAKASRGTKLPPVGCTTQPVKVVAQEGVDGGSSMHVAVGKDGGAMAHAVAAVYDSLDILQDLQIAVIMPETKHWGGQSAGRMWAWIGWKRDPILMLVVAGWSMRWMLSGGYQVGHRLGDRHERP